MSYQNLENIANKIIIEFTSSNNYLLPEYSVHFDIYSAWIFTIDPLFSEEEINNVYIKKCDEQYPCNISYFSYEKKSFMIITSEINNCSIQYRKDLIFGTDIWLVQQDILCKTPIKS